MKKKALLAIFAAFTISATMFTVGCGEFNTGGGFLGNIFNPTPGNGGGNSGNTDGEDDTDNKHNTVKPEFTITNQNGDWAAQGQIAVLGDGCLAPGTTGEYQFIIKSDSAETLTYRFTLSEYLDNVGIDDPFMMYRVAFNNMYLSEDWHYADYVYGAMQILPNSEHVITLQWQFPFDAEHDFTYDDFKDKQLALNIYIWAEVNVG